jgi:hypothetical protein
LAERTVVSAPERLKSSRVAALMGDGRAAALSSTLTRQPPRL